MAILSTQQIQQAQTIINNTQAGCYELKSLYGQNWQSINSPTTFGADFKETVLAGMLSKIRFNSLRSNNHNIYEIF